ncbi:MAG: F0F1 ATP synthase subunit B [Verrucomicrobiota bacterium]
MEVLNDLGVYWPKLIAQVINFTIILLVLRFFVYKPILKKLEERRTKIADSVANAERIKKELEEAEIARAERIKQANAEAAKLLAEARESADNLGARKVQEAIAQAEGVLKKAEEAAIREREEMMKQLRAEMGRLVVDTTSKVVGKTLTDADRKRLQDEAVSQIS